MKLKNQQINTVFAAVIACVAVYILFVLVRDIGDVYKGWQTFFDQPGSIYPALIVGITAVLPISVAIISHLVYSNRRTYFILLPIAHIVLLFPGYIVYGMVLLILIWWFSKYALKST